MGGGVGVVEEADEQEEENEIKQDYKMHKS